MIGEFQFDVSFRCSLATCRTIVSPAALTLRTSRASRVSFLPDSVSRGLTRSRSFPPRPLEIESFPRSSATLTTLPLEYNCVSNIRRQFDTLTATRDTHVSPIYAKYLISARYCITTTAYFCRFITSSQLSKICLLVNETRWRFNCSKISVEMERGWSRSRGSYSWTI